jgi:hypothetical protein
MNSYQLNNACSLCGADGTNKTTCPRNKDAKNPDPAKHNCGKKSIGGAKSLVKKAVAKTEKVSFPKTRQRHIVKITLTGRNGDYNPNYTDAVIEKIIDWYNDRINGSSWYAKVISGLNIKHIKKDLFQLSYKQIGDMFFTAMLDPDEDGYNPIIINGEEYIVFIKKVDKPVIKKVSKPVVKKVDTAFPTTRQYHNIRVTLFGKSGDYNPDYTDAVIKKIINWYNDRIDGSSWYAKVIKEFEIKHVKKDTFQLSYKQIGNMSLISMLDPDEDGYNPIKINGEEYIVFIKLI